MGVLLTNRSKLFIGGESQLRIPAVMACPKWGVLVVLLCLCGCATSVTNHSPVIRQGMMGVAEERAGARAGNPLGELSLRELVQRGRACSEEDNTSLAQVYFRAALKRDENSAAAWSGLADTFKKTGDFAKAGKLLAVALEKDPDNASLLLALGKMDRRRKKPEQALHWFEQALENRSWKFGGYDGNGLNL